MSENQQNDRQEDVLPDETVGADGAESAEPVNGVVPGAASGCANTGIGAGGDESVFRGKPNAGSQHGTRYPIPLDIRGTAGI